MRSVITTREFSETIGLADRYGLDHTPSWGAWRQDDVGQGHRQH